MTRYVVDDLKRSIERARRDYAAMAESSTLLADSIERLMMHARGATKTLGTDGFLAYFEEEKTGKGPDAVDLLNELAKEFNTMLKPDDDDPDAVSPLFHSFLPIHLTLSST